MRGHEILTRILKIESGTRLSICYYKNLDSIYLNDYNIWDATQTVLKSYFFFLKLNLNALTKEFRLLHF